MPALMSPSSSENMRRPDHDEDIRVRVRPHYPEHAPAFISRRKHWPRCAGEPYGVCRSICVLLSDTTTGEQATAYVDAVLVDGDDEIGFQSDPDRGEWSGDAALEAAVSAHSHAIYWTVFEVLNQLAGALMPSALDAIEQQKRGA